MPTAACCICSVFLFGFVTPAFSCVICVSPVLRAQCYVEAISMEVMGDAGDEFDSGKRNDRMFAELAKAHAQLGEREFELQKMRKV